MIWKEPRLFSSFLTLRSWHSTVSRRIFAPALRHLDEALALETEHAILRSVITRFQATEAWLDWNWRSTYDNSASENFLTGTPTR